VTSAAGWEHFHRAEWAEARDAFAAVLEVDRDDPEALDGLGRALWWLGEREAGIERRREAYAAYQRRGESRRAGGLAVYLAGEQRIDGQDAAASGWLARARRLLAEADDCAETGWLAVEDAKRAPDAQTAEGHARAALAIAHALADADIECMALAQLGRALIAQGRVDEGVGFLDESMTVALGGESTDPLACGDACCQTLAACASLADLQRAAQWCESVVAFSERRHFVPVQSWCRGIYGGVLVRAGDWARAEAVLTAALKGPPGHDGKRVPALAALAELRLNQGRYEEAARLLEGIESERDALAPAVRLHIERDALDVAEALLAGREDADALALRGEVALARDDRLCEAERAQAAALADELARAAASLAREDLTARAALLRGRATGQLGALADAVARFDALAFPFDAAGARLALAHAQAAAGSPLAESTTRAARETFERLGARREADRASALLRELGAPGRSVTHGSWDELTGREREVLELICEGLSNAAIAERLVIAPKTAEHHVSRVLAKLGARSRAEAAALAVREGLLS
jgi:DNA-binding CsgD family transcriptional regulator/tetratricopeptide (TPR) repeat protein